MWSEFWPQKKQTIIPTKHHECPSNMGYQLTFKMNPVNEYEPCLCRLWRILAEQTEDTLGSVMSTR